MLKVSIIGASNDLKLLCFKRLKNRELSISNDRILLKLK